MDLKMYEIKSDEELADIERKLEVSGLLRLDAGCLKRALLHVNREHVGDVCHALDAVEKADTLIKQVGFAYKLPSDINKSIAIYKAMKKIETFNPHAKGDGKNYGRD